jgi:hypothetical protein
MEARGRRTHFMHAEVDAGIRDDSKDSGPASFVPGKRKCDYMDKCEIDKAEHHDN